MLNAATAPLSSTVSQWTINHKKYLPRDGWKVVGKTAHFRIATQDEAHNRSHNGRNDGEYMKRISKFFTASVDIGDNFQCIDVEFSHRL